MKPLDAVITRTGFIYTQLQASDKAYLYEQKDKNTGLVVGYEVFKHRENKEHEIAGNVIAASVAFPSNESFGLWAWTCRTLAQAEARFELLNQQACE
jgi:hypothetical protein